MGAKKIFISLYILFIMFLLTSCAPIGMTHEEYGFFFGIAHGFTSPLILLAKLFGTHLGLYAAHNSGLFYWLGFVLGLAILFCGGGGSYASRK